MADRPRGNPIEMAAVIWQVEDTAKAVNTGSLYQ